MRGVHPVVALAASWAAAGLTLSSSALAPSCIWASPPPASSQDLEKSERDRWSWEQIRQSRPGWGGGHPGSARRPHSSVLPAVGHMYACVYMYL